MWRNPKFFALATVLLWSAFAPLAKTVSKSEYLFITLSFTFTTLTFFTGLALRRKRAVWARLRDVRPRFLFFGLFGYFLYWFALIQAFREFSSASGATVLNYTWPVFTVVFTELIFRREPKSGPRRSLEALGIGLGFAAVVVLATRGQVLSFEITHGRGLLWGLLAGASYGFYSAYSGTVDRMDHTLFLFVSAAVSLAAMFPLALTELDLLWSMTWKDWAVVAVLGSAVDGGGYFLWTSANLTAREMNVDISAVSSIVFFLPLISVVIVSLIFGETEMFKPYFAVTLILLIAGSVICQRTREIAAGLEKRPAGRRP